MSEKHKHIWKYSTGKMVRVCESPYSKDTGCGKEEYMTAFGGWVDSEEVIKNQYELNQ